MAELLPAIHEFFQSETKTWMPGTRPGMTSCFSDLEQFWQALFELGGKSVERVFLDRLDLG